MNTLDTHIQIKYSLGTCIRVETVSFRGIFQNPYADVPEISYRVCVG
jgi:hypothetical protein